MLGQSIVCALLVKLNMDDKLGNPEPHWECSLLVRYPQQILVNEN